MFKDLVYNTRKNDLLKLYNDEHQLRNELITTNDKLGLYSLAILIEIAIEEDNIFWYDQLGFYSSFCFSHINGANHIALYFFCKALDKEPDNVLLLSAILDFDSPPEKILSKELKLEVAKRILQIKPDDKRANSILSRS